MDSYVIIFDNIVKFVEHLEKYSDVHVFFDDFVDKNVVEYLLSAIETKKVSKSFFPCPVASVCLAEKIKFQNEQVVVAIGGTNVQNLAKYYAFLYDIDYVSVPVHECSEYLMSKYAFVKDKYFCFYECAKPKIVFVMNRCFDDIDRQNMKNILLYKNIVLFEKEFEKDIFCAGSYSLEKIVKCVNICDFALPSIIKLLGICANELEFESPYAVLGDEYYFLALMPCKNMTMDTMGVQNILVKLYDCYLKFVNLSKQIDINLHLKTLKTFGIDMLDTTETILPIFDESAKKEIDYRLNAYLPYLRDLFDRATNKFVPSRIENVNNMTERALAVCSGLFSRKSMLRFMRDFGYFDNLLAE